MIEVSKKLPCYAQPGDSRTACGSKVTDLMEEFTTTAHSDVNCAACLRVVRKWYSIYPDGSFRQAGKNIGKPKNRGRHVARKKRTIKETSNEGGQSSAERKEPEWKTNSLFASPDVGPLAKQQAAKQQASRYPEGWV